MATKARATTISIGNLSKAVDQAVALAAKRQNIAVEAGTIAVNWEIIGRQIKALKDMNVAMAFAADVTKSLKVDGIKPEPIVWKRGPDILVGFIERSQIARQFS